jgi:hypothetical protein
MTVLIATVSPYALSAFANLTELLGKNGRKFPARSLGSFDRWDGIRYACPAVNARGGYAPPADCLGDPALIYFMHHSTDKQMELEINASPKPSG